MVIPPITHSMGRHWRQPDPKDIGIINNPKGGHSALVSRGAFDLLAEYSASLPSGVYEGKMWKKRSGAIWLLCWYDSSPDPERCSVNYMGLYIKGAWEHPLIMVDVATVSGVKTYAISLWENGDGM